MLQAQGIKAAADKYCFMGEHFLFFRISFPKQVFMPTIQDEFALVIMDGGFQGHDAGCSLRLQIDHEKALQS